MALTPKQQQIHRLNNQATAISALSIAISITAIIIKCMK